MNNLTPEQLAFRAGYEQGRFDAQVEAAQQRHISYVCPQCHWSLDKQPAQQEPVTCERCEELGYDKARYFRLYEQACIELQKIKKQEAVAEIKISHSDLEGEVIEILSCELDAGTYELYTSPPASKQWVGLVEQERNDLEDYCEMIIGKAAFDAIEAKLKEKNT